MGKATFKGGFFGIVWIFSCNRIFLKEGIFSLSEQNVVMSFNFISHHNLALFQISNILACFLNLCQPYVNIIILQVSNKTVALWKSEKKLELAIAWEKKHEISPRLLEDGSRQDKTVGPLVLRIKK